MAAPMKAIIFTVCLSFLLHSDVFCVKQLTSRDHKLIVVHDDSYLEFSPFINAHRSIRSVGLYHNNNRHKRETFRKVSESITIPEDKKNVLFEFSDTTRNYDFVSSTVKYLLILNGNSLNRNTSMKLDYEDPAHRTITVIVNGTKNNDDVVQTELTITVTNVNDEYPVFKNQPVPFLATVGLNTGPNVKVYEVIAEDSDPNSNVTYALESGGEGRFRIETVNVYDEDMRANIKVGRILTEGQGQFADGRRYDLVVVAQDVSTFPPQRTLKTVQVLVGVRPPQFYKEAYHGSVFENNGIGQTLQGELKVRAKPFQDKTITYQLLDENNRTSVLFRIDGDGTVLTQQLLDYESVPRQQRPPTYNLQIKAIEAETNLYALAPLEVQVKDMNDNDPIFSLSQYQASVQEDHPVGDSVLRVTATDDDSGTNAELEYSIDHELFMVQTVKEGGSWIGVVKVKAPLDYDEVPSHMYIINVKAQDKGAPIRTGTAIIRVFTTNVNDNKPMLQPPTIRHLMEDAEVGKQVTMLVAVDLDGDNFKFYFSPQKTTSEIFEIIPDSGLIKTTATIPQDKNSYTLNISVIDDGSCCSGPDIQQHNSYIVIEITDINDQKPTFINCNGYTKLAKVAENQQVGTSVIRVSAQDGDRGDNGKVSYSVLRSDNQQPLFAITDPMSGEVTTAAVFDREKDRFISLTILARDGGKPSLEGYCTFRVIIEDENDNAPKFDQTEYHATIPQSYGTERSVITVRASDIDIGENASLSYFFVANEDSRFFKIDTDIGLIKLNKSALKETYIFSVMAKDHGNPPLNSTARVTIKVANRTSVPPSWDDPNYDTTPYTINETASFSQIITVFSATSNVDNPILTFHLIDDTGNPREIVDPFRVQTNRNSATLSVYGRMDINQKDKYQLRLRVTNRGAVSLSSEIHPTIHLIDTNNQIPVFDGLDKNTGYYPGSVAENMEKGQRVIEVKAYDADQNPPNNVLKYTLQDPSNAPGISKKFYLDVVDNNTVIVRSNASFDREAIPNSKVYVDIMVQDGAPSTLNTNGLPNSAVATIEVTITDMNDNPPVFPQNVYNATVDEDAVIGSKVILVQARDVDSAATLLYSIKSGNTRNAFKVQEKDGQIMVGRQLDYESSDPKVYPLVMEVYDGIYTSSTTVNIKVRDVNDNPPMFTENTYIVDDVVEEDPNISPSNKRYLLTVSATDADKNRPTRIRYKIPGNAVNTFQIDETSGELFLLKPLDRDEPNGKALYQFNVQAQDEDIHPNYGYTSVQIRLIDINDNSPIRKNSLTGRVPEHSKQGTVVMTVAFEDYDEGRNGSTGLTYRFVEWESAGQRELFSIDADGIIRTNTNENNLDRETTAQYKPIILVEDGGPGNTKRSTTATLTIQLSDINDNKPEFQDQPYKMTLSENQKSGRIGRVVATDRDVGNNAKLQYSLVNSAEIFRIDTVNNEGIMNVFQPVDYEDVSQRFFNITVRVQDPEPSHYDEAYVQVTVIDFNDNEPKFSIPLQVKSVLENIPVGTSIAHFSASDKDSSINKEFVFSIDRKTDPHKLFTITQYGEEGNITIRNELDRETQALHVLHILAIDKGDPALTGTATLSLTVLDVNDNAPIFAADYHPVVMENDQNYPKLIIKVNGTDRDANPFGPPFGFADLCPKDPVCAFFSLQFQPNGDGGNGWALVSTKAEYDREKTKYYYMPIVMWDMRGHKDAPRLAMTGTNTLTIEIGDENDNKHGPGHKEIFVYNYKGLFGDIEIGNVYATDPDDWDRVDKTFIYTGPEFMKKYFVVNEGTGIITMQKGVPSDEYTFTVRVVDEKWQGLAADCSVTVTIQDLPEEAVYNSGAVRLSGITAEEFVERKKKQTDNIKEYEDSKLDKFRRLLADKLNVPTENVDIFSIMNNGQFTDVRYSAHGSPYYPSERTDTVLVLNKKQFESDVGITIAMVPINECLKEVFVGGCYNFLNVTGRPKLVNTNGTSLIGVETFVQATEGCRPPLTTCSPNYCLNGGTCSVNDGHDPSCECPPPPSSCLNGPRCQETRHSFDGNSFSMFPTLEQCEGATTSISIITTKENGLILYNGPEGVLAKDQPRDFISLELLNGYPKLRIDLGTGELELYVNGRDSHGTVIMQKLSDGKWHHIEVIRKGREVKLIVDHCESAWQSTDKMVCEKSGTTPGINEFLNVGSMLHLGGTNAKPIYPANLQPAGFDGCVKRLMHNGRLYDLTVKQSLGYSSGKPGCQREDSICGVTPPCGESVCGKNGLCVSSWKPSSYVCICKPMWRGRQCSIETTVKDMKSQSYFEWHLNNSFYNKLHGVGDWKLQLHIMFRTRDEDGVLLTLSSADGHQAITLQIIKTRLILTYMLDGVSRNLELYYRHVSNGQWHTVEMQRFGKEFILTMDNGEENNYNRTFSEDDKDKMTISTTVHAGAIPSQSSGVTVVDKDLEDTCVNDIRMNNRYFPMQYNENNDINLAASLTKNPNIADGCHRDDCLGVVCPPPEVCYPLWGDKECRCPKHYERINGLCQMIVYCNSHNCFSGSTCVEDLSMDRGYRCECPPGWTGDFCNQQAPGPLTAGITTAAIVAIVISVFVLLVLALVVILFVKFVETKKADDKYILEVDSYDDIRENVINYDEEGAGEEDQEGYDINRLRKPEDSLYKPHDPMMRRDVPLTNAPGETPDVGNFINDRLGDADQDGGAPPHDSVREFAHEGGDSDAGSLSSLNTTSSTRSQDYDYLNDWGPKFAKLADMYGAGQEAEED
ncbi:neural-cadherin-like [Gigantopelta aegis]|uniref:neural-cadherin-like n=1 Tax=Gigantopelta aegis TaxID=1735272 RepID=UPI001B88C5D5|nr:neural-cadherin-like [Gigantopelta aegis]